MTRYYYEIDNGQHGWIDAESIESAREIFATDHPDTAPECAGVWGPDDSEYPEDQ